MCKIMLVDDVEISNFITKKMISRISNDIEIVDYTFPEMAIEFLEEVNPDIIFLDINMPIMNGWEFLQTMREKNYKHKVYVLTSSTSHADLQESKTFENVVDLLTKPLNAQVLNKIIESIQKLQLAGQ